MNKKDQIILFLEKGFSYSEISKKTGAASSTISYHAKKSGLQQNTFKRKTYDWMAIQSYYDLGHTIQETISHYGLNRSSLDEASQRGVFLKSKDTPERKVKLKEMAARLASEGNPRSKSKKPISDILIEQSPYDRGYLKKRLIDEGIKKYCCEGIGCQIEGIINPLWAGTILILHLDHKNGKRNDNRIENLRFLCPNCHSQTATYCGRNNVDNALK